jgi:hypothetical protein
MHITTPSDRRGRELRLQARPLLVLSRVCHTGSHNHQTKTKKPFTQIALQNRGLLTLIFDKLSPRSKRNVILFALGSVASCFTLFIGYIAFEMLALSPFNGLYSFALVPLCFCACAVTLWLEFYQTLRNREE